MQHVIKTVIGIACLFGISLLITPPPAHAQPVDLYSVPAMEPYRVPDYSVLDAATIRNEETGVVYTLKRYKAIGKLSEGKAWLADMAYQKKDPQYPVFLPLQCEAKRPDLMLCEDIVMPQMQGDSIARTGVTSGNIEAVKLKVAAR